MKNILSGLVLMLVFLPHISFGQTQPSFVNPADATFSRQHDSEAKSFFQQEAQERAAFIQAHSNLIAKQNAYGKALIAWKNTYYHHGVLDPNAPPQPALEATPDDGAYAAFIAQQKSEGNAFYSKWQQERQRHFNPQAGVNP